MTRKASLWVRIDQDDQFVGRIESDGDWSIGYVGPCATREALREEARRLCEFYLVDLTSGSGSLPDENAGMLLDQSRPELVPAEAAGPEVLGVMITDNVLLGEEFPTPKLIRLDALQAILEFIDNHRGDAVAWIACNHTTGNVSVLVSEGPLYSSAQSGGDVLFQNMGYISLANATYHHYPMPDGIEVYKTDHGHDGVIVVEDVGKDS